MNIYEKTLAQIERRNEPVHSYKVVVKAISEKAKELEADKALKNWEHIFYYNDPAETEEQRGLIVLQYAREGFSRNFYGDIEGKTAASISRKTLDFGVDYKFDIKKVL